MKNRMSLQTREEDRSGLIDGIAAERAVQWLFSHCETPSFLRSIADVLQWLDDVKAWNHMFQKRVGLNTLADWSMDANGHIVQKEGRFFKIIGIRVFSEAREVTEWSQPILDNVGTGIIGMLLKQVGAATSYLMQAKAEVGNRHVVQLAPTVQFTQENYAGSRMLTKPFLFDEFSAPRTFTVVRESRQSEEGARFHREQHVHRVLRLPEHYELELPDEFRWMSSNELRYFLHSGEHVNSCARSILACLL